MSVGYLLTLGVIATFAAIALWPPHRPRFAAQVAYFMGVTVNEVPHLALGLPLSIATAFDRCVARGAERVAVQLMDRLDPVGFEMRMGLLRAAGPYMDGVDPAKLLVAGNGHKHFNYDGASGDHITPLKVVSSALRAPAAFRRMIRQVQPDVVLSFLRGTSLFAWASMWGMVKGRPAWIAREGNNVLAVAHEESPNSLIAGVNLALSRGAYRRADAVLTNSTDMSQGLVSDLGLDPRRMRMIHNPIDIAGIREAARTVPERIGQRPFLLSAGRLEFQKAHGVLLKAFARSGLSATHDLVILGHGSPWGERDDHHQTSENPHLAPFDPCECDPLAGRWGTLRRGSNEVSRWDIAGFPVDNRAV